jgi:hypothetical protein
MSASTRAELWDRLKTAGLAQGDLPTSAASPWYVRAMLGVAGWIGALFLLGFIGAIWALALRTSGTAALAGIGCCCGAYAVFTAAPRNDLANQFGLATGIAGQVIFAVSLSHLFRSGTSAGYLLFFLIEAVLTLLIPNFTHRIFTTLAGVAALSLGLAEAGLHGLAVPITAAGCAYVWRREMRLPGPDDLWEAVGYGVALGVLQTATTALLQTETLRLFHGSVENGWLPRHGAELGTALACGVFLLVVADILRELGISGSSREGVATLSCATLLMAASFPAHALAPALLLVILGFAAGNRVLLGLGFLAMAGFLSHYYYQMQETLLFKSFILCETGVVLLAARWVLGRVFPAGEGSEHA